MAITSTTSVDIIGGTQTLNIFNASSVQIDQIVYSNNSITFGQIISYNLAQTDLLLYLQFINVYAVLLSLNFPSVAPNVNLILPVCSLQISLTDVGIEHVIYTQTSGSSTVLNINFLPSIQSASIGARASAITITMQEWLEMIELLAIYNKQVTLQ